MRTWLRIEFFDSAIVRSSDNLQLRRCTPFFPATRAIFRCTGTWRGQDGPAKELERQQRKLQSWVDIPGVDGERIDALRQQLKQCGATLMSAPRIGQFLREDRLIALVRQRLSIPGGCCSFDLPTLHIWLHMPRAYRDEQVGV